MKIQISFCVKKLDLYLTKIQISFCVKKIRSENTDQFLSLKKIKFENTDQFFSFHKRTLLAIANFET